MFVEPVEQTANPADGLWNLRTKVFRRGDQSGCWTLHTASRCMQLFCIWPP